MATERSSTENPHQIFDPGLAKGIMRAIRLYAGTNPFRLFPLLKRSMFFQQAVRRRHHTFHDENVIVPPLLILSATMKCDLNCTGCYSRNYPLDNELTIHEIDHLFCQAESLGVAFFVITGGEPLLKKGLMDLLIQHDRLNFFLFTNGSFHDESWTRQICRQKHIVPLISVEGNCQHTDDRRGQGVHARVIASMERLKYAHIFFGFSAMVSRKNIKCVGQAPFWDEMIAQGCRIGYFVNYVPSGQDDLSLVPSPNEQAWFREQVNRLKKEKKIIIIHMPDDEYANGGVCMAAGRGFLHINAQGFVEPCPFAHVATDNIRTQSLKDILKSPLFSYIREHEVLLKKPTLGCALYENRKLLMDIADSLGAQSTEMAV
ncbi:radical SAM protein [bacterium]|nr:radical SAM protein [bacterium]